MDPCILTKTGTNLLPLILLVAVLVISLTSLVFYSKKSSMSLLGFAFLFSLSLGLTSLTPSVSAQSLPEECISSEAPADDAEAPGVVLGLQDDFGLVQIPNDIDTRTVGYVAILNNDNPPAGDPYDWNTIDLDLSEPDQQTQLDITHPDDNSFSCGSINLNTFGVLSVHLNYDCNNEDWDLITIPEDYTVPTFQYTVETKGGESAPEPASVTIGTQSDPVTGVVVAENDYSGTCSTNGLSGFSLLSNDSTTAGVLDPLTIDLDLSKSGRQTSVVIFDYEVTVNSAGELSIIPPPNAYTYDIIEGYYSVSNSVGDVSNIASFNLGCAPAL